MAARLALFMLIVFLAGRLGGERADALRDLLMHPRARALTRAEFDVVTALPRLLIARLTGQRRPGTE